jgi:hypothetical protein
MWNARNALDPRLALDSGSVDPPDRKADAKLAGRVQEVEDPASKKVSNARSGGGEPSGQR